MTSEEINALVDAFQNPQMFNRNMDRLESLRMMESELGDDIRWARGLKMQGPAWMRKGISNVMSSPQGAVRPTLYGNPQYLSQMERNMSSILGEKKIAEAAANLHRPMGTPPIQPPAMPGPGMPGINPSLISRMASMIPKGLFAAELMAPSPLNANEEEELAKRRPPLAKQEPMPVMSMPPDFWGSLFRGR